MNGRQKTDEKYIISRARLAKREKGSMIRLWNFPRLNTAKSLPRSFLRVISHERNRLPRRDYTYIPSAFVQSHVIREGNTLLKRRNVFVQKKIRLAHFWRSGIKYALQIDRWLLFHLLPSISHSWVLFAILDCRFASKFLDYPPWFVWRVSMRFFANFAAFFLSFNKRVQLKRRGGTLRERVNDWLEVK